MMPHLKSLLFKMIPPLFLFLMSAVAYAQDTECKDDQIQITIFTRLKVEGLGCTSCFDSLAAFLANHPGVRNLKKQYAKASITFSMPSLGALDRVSINKIVRHNGLIIIDLEFSKVPLEEVPELDIVF
jgi:copper chaperone CopZ